MKTNSIYAYLRQPEHIPSTDVFNLSSPIGGNYWLDFFNMCVDIEPMNREVLDTILEAKVLVEQCRVGYNHIRPHSSLGYRPPAPEAIIPLSA